MRLRAIGTPSAGFPTSMRVNPLTLATLTALCAFSASCAAPSPLLPVLSYGTATGPGPVAAAKAKAKLGPRAAAPAAFGLAQGRYGDRNGSFESSKGSYGRERAPGDYGYQASGNYDPRDEERGRYDTDPTVRLQVLFAGRDLNGDEFDPTDRPGVFGLELSQVPEAGGLGFEFGVNFAFDEEENISVPGIGNADLELAQAEIYAGARAEFGRGAVRPYIGGGGALLTTQTTVEQGFSEAESDDTIFGGYVHGGIQADVNDRFFIGLDYRHFFGGDLDIAGVDVDSDYDQIAIVLGINL